MTNLNDFWILLGHISLFQWIVGIISSVFFGFAIYVWRYIRIQWRFMRNLKRKVYFLKTSNDKILQTEKDLIKKIELFNVESDIKDITNDIKVTQGLDKNAVYIVGYNKDYKNYKKLVDKASDKNIPVIIFAKQGEIRESEHWDVFNSYIYCDVANTSSRLAVILMNTLIITK